MATVSLPIRETETARQARPRLVLQEYDQEVDKVLRPARRRARRQNIGENLLFAAAVIAVVVFCVMSLAQSVSHTVSAPYKTALPNIVLPVTVHPGDTLWTYAQKYGAPDAYILDRMETIARANHLAPTAALIPGQRLRIPVTNPFVIAQLQSQRRIAQRR